MFDFSIYIHYPFCVRKCPYCAFVSQTWERDLADQCEAVVETELRRHIEQPPWTGGRAATLYFGGGTPSLANPAFIAGIIDLARKNSSLPEDAEITLEANPGTVDRSRLVNFRAAGVNRLSLGAQSFQDDELARLGRIHRSEDIYRGVETARQAGFDNLSLDLMYNLPGQSLASLEDSLRRFLDLNLEHLSTYSLSIEPGTAYERERLAGLRLTPDPDSAADYYDLICSMMSRAGFQHYELTNFCRAGRHSRHNYGYWRRIPYLGIGPGAHGFDGRRRYWNVEKLSDYCGRIESGERGIEAEEIITPEMQREEEVYLALRCDDGLKMPEAERLIRKEAVIEMIEEGFLEWRGNRLKVRESRWLLLDEIVLRLLA